MYAKGKHAFGFCDRTGFRYPLKDLVYEYKDGKRTGLRVGRDQVDKDHPQLRLGRTQFFDPQALRDPRPDTTVESVWSWNPVGGPSQSMTLWLGTVTIDLSQASGELGDDSGNQMGDESGNVLASSGP